MLFQGSCSKIQTENSTSESISDGKNQTEFYDRNTFQGSPIMDKMSFNEQVEMYWKFFFGKKQTTPSTKLPQESVDPNRLISLDKDQLQVAWLGHSSLLIITDGCTILTDPVLERRISPIGPTRFHKTLPLEVQDIPVIDVVLISHNHYDRVVGNAKLIHLGHDFANPLVHQLHFFDIDMGSGFPSRSCLAPKLSSEKEISFPISGAMSWTRLELVGDPAR